MTERNRKPGRKEAAELVRDAGGRIVGRTRLQKIGFFLELAGLGAGFKYNYRHYGPYSEELAESLRIADAFGLIEEEERQTNRGGMYSIFKFNGNLSDVNAERKRFIREALNIDAISLELAATAAYLSVIEKAPAPWRETEDLKPEKAQGDRINNAKQLYDRLRGLATPIPLPEIIDDERDGSFWEIE